MAPTVPAVGSIGGQHGNPVVQPPAIHPSPFSVTPESVMEKRKVPENVPHAACAKGGFVRVTYVSGRPVWTCDGCHREVVLGELAPRPSVFTPSVMGHLASRSRAYRIETV